MTTEAELLLAIRLRDGGAALYDLAYLASHHTIHPAYSRIAYRMTAEGWARRPATEVVAEAARRFAAEQAGSGVQEVQP
jgi:hypothetical protein